MTRLTMILPPGWVFIDLLSPIDAQVATFRGFVERTYADEAAAYSGVLTDLPTKLEELANAGAIAFATAVVDAAVLGQPAVIVSRFLPPTGMAPMDALIAIAATDSTAELFDMTNRVALRTTHDRDRTQDLVLALSSNAGASSTANILPGLPRAAQPRLFQRALRYLVGDPTDQGSWLDVSATVVFLKFQEELDGAAFATSLLDDVVATLDWEL